MKLFTFLFLILLLFVSCSAGEPSTELTQHLDSVAALNISRNGYILGKALTDTQKKPARQNLVEIDNPQLFKFKDGDLYIVAGKNNDRVIIIYEQHDDISQKKAQDLVGTLFLDFGEPTVFSHDKVIYWAWGENGRISNEAYKSAKNNQDPLNVLATVKLNSTIKIMEAKEAQASGNIYYIISSDPVLKLIQPK